MYTLTTQLDSFRFNSIVQRGPVTVTWFVCDKDEDGDESGRHFTMNELNLFQNFTLEYPFNFPGVKNYHHGNEEDNLPYCSLYDDLPDERRDRPSQVILKKQPQLSKSGITKCMDIVLCDQSQSTYHRFDLPFDVIGVVDGW